MLEVGLPRKQWSIVVTRCWTSFGPGNSRTNDVICAQARAGLAAQAMVSRALSRGVIQLRNARSLSGTGFRGA